MSASSRPISVTSAHIPLAYFLVLDFKAMGTESTIDWERSRKENILETLVTGDYSGALRHVYCIDRDGGRFNDVSEDFAREAAELALETFEEIPAHLRNFVDEYVGAGTCDAWEAARFGGRSDFAEHSTLHRAAQGI